MDCLLQPMPNNLNGSCMLYLLHKSRFGPKKKRVGNQILDKF